PGGLALVVQKMLAKRPADRFQSAAEVAEALAPHVAGSSASFQSIRNTSAWEGGRLTLREFSTHRRLLPWAVAGLSLVALLLVVGLAFGPRWFGGSQTPSDAESDNSAGPLGNEAGKDVLPDDPNVLNVSQTAAGGGKYRTINEALDRVKAGQ